MRNWTESWRDRIIKKKQPIPVSMILSVSALWNPLGGAMEDFLPRIADGEAVLNHNPAIFRAWANHFLASAGAILDKLLSAISLVAGTRRV
jgi:hypothetical protein